MKTLLTAICAAFALTTASGAFAADEKKQPTAQQNKMKTCNKEAGDKSLKGDERKKFMSECLKGDGGATAAKADNANCEAKAVSKDGKKLAGAAKAASIKKCEAEAAGGEKAGAK